MTPAASLSASVNALMQANRPIEAARTLRRALDLAPLDSNVQAATARLVAVARGWLGTGQAAVATESLALLAGSVHAGAAVLMPYGYGLMMLGRTAEAIDVFRRWLAIAPDSRDAALRLAAALADADGAMEAEALLRSVIARHGHDADVAFVRARALVKLSRFEEAETELRKVVRDMPEHATAHANLMELVWMRTGDADAALRAIERSLRARPGLSALRVNKARLLLSARRAQEALVALDAGLALAPSEPVLLRAAATVALEFDGARSLEYVQRLLAVAPDDRVGRVALGNALLATGRADAALAAADALYPATPTDGRIVALQADALRMLGDPSRRGLMDYQALVCAQFIDVPQGWSCLDDYLAELVDALRGLHTLNAHPIGNSLRNGSQVELDPERSPHPAIHAFPQAIDGPIKRFMAALGRGQDPLRKRNTGAYSVSGIWSVRLRPHGFHANHHHPLGWISSACYLHLPPAVAARGGEGWLRFGEPAFPTQPPLPPEYFLQPAPGLLALFPSYMWHGTVPFSGCENDSRLTIAFDLLPA